MSSPPFSSSLQSIPFDLSSPLHISTPSSRIPSQENNFEELLKNLTEQINKLDAKQESFELSKNKNLFEIDMKLCHIEKTENQHVLDSKKELLDRLDREKRNNVLSINRYYKRIELLEYATKLEQELLHTEDQLASDIGYDENEMYLSGEVRRRARQELIDRLLQQRSYESSQNGNYESSQNRNYESLQNRDYESSQQRNYESSEKSFESSNNRNDMSKSMSKKDLMNDTQRDSLNNEQFSGYNDHGLLKYGRYGKSLTLGKNNHIH